MKRPKKPTRDQKMIIAKYGLEPKDYAVIQETCDNLLIINKETKQKTDIRF